jgi:hypothetical protein
MWVRLPTQIQWQNSNWRSNETAKKFATLRTPDGTNIERWPRLHLPRLVHGEGVADIAQDRQAA